MEKARNEITILGVVALIEFLNDRKKSREKNLLASNKMKQLRKIYPHVNTNELHSFLNTTKLLKTKKIVTPASIQPPNFNTKIRIWSSPLP